MIFIFQQGWKDMYKAGFRMAKTFASVGLVYSAAECTIEKVCGSRLHLLFAKDIHEALLVIAGAWCA